MKKLSKFSVRLSAVIRSDLFFYSLIILFVLSAVWSATASLYPMAFDEDFHMGLIKIYASSWLPYGIEHTRDMATYGGATADPSYLFHYLMSFPYRLMDWLGWSEQTTVIMLRLLNVALITASIVVYRKALLTANVSRAVSHVALGFFTLIPILPVMAGQVNYDNLLLLIVAFAFLAIIRIDNSLRSTKKLPIRETWLLFILVLFGMPTKYAFLPIAASLGIWFAWLLVKDGGIKKAQVRISDFLRRSWRLPIPAKAVIGTVVLFGCFFSAHYVTNFVTYGNPMPACHEVFDETACMNYGPWERNFLLRQELDSSFQPMSFPSYIIAEWLPGMSNRLDFAVAGPTNNYQTKQPLPIIHTLLIGLTLLGAIVFLVRFRQIFKRYSSLVLLTLLSCILYVLPLMWKLYLAYVATGEPVAINGRYLLPLLPLIAALMILSLQDIFHQFKLSKFSGIFFIAMVLVAIVGGAGIGTHIILSEPHWYWTGWGQASHEVLQSVLRILVIH